MLHSKSDLLVTVHVDLSCGHTYHFQAQGFPEQVMQSIGVQIFETFQRTQFPSKIKIGNQQLEFGGLARLWGGACTLPKICRNGLQGCQCEIAHRG
jgi:hypothetical protein